MALRDNISYPFFIQTVFFLLVFGNSHVYSQMANFGVVIYTDTAAIVKVQGNFSNDQAGSVQHNGLLDIDNQFINTNGQVRGNGKYRVTGDWINSALFIPDTSHVFLRGAAQQITGSVSTHFYNLTLQGSGLKRQTLNSFVGNNFNLNNLEFSTDIDTIFVSNKTNSAIRYDNSFTAEGFISSMKDGCVAWKTASLQNYIFPVGNKVPSYRFRPIAVLSSKNTDKYYYVRFINHDPTMDAKPVSQKDTLTCIVNTNFYHMVNRDTDGDSCILSVYYLPADGTWTNNSQWNSQWKTLKSQNTTTSNFKTLSANIINFNQPYFALSTIAGPTPPLLSTAVCSGDSVRYNLPANAGNYHWTVSKGTVLSSSKTSLTVKWDSTANAMGQIKLSFNNGFCESLPSYNVVTLKQTPSAYFATDTGKILIGTIALLNNQSKNASSYSWDFADGSTITEENPQHIFGSSGNFPVRLLAKSSNGCSKSYTKLLTVGEELKIPDVFTPNQDGKNDYFSFLGTNSYNLEIYNRWGELIYQGNENNKWDGTNLSGQMCTGGTYYYILFLKDRKNKILNGFVSLIR